MKRLLMVAFAAFGFMTITSCGDNDKPAPGPEGTSCRVINNATLFTSVIGADGTMYDAKVIFYSETAEISETAIGTLAHSGGTSDFIIAPEGATKARVAFLMLPSTNTDPANVIQYTVDSFALTEGASIDITITDATMISATKDGTKGFETMTFGEALLQF